MIFGHSVDTCPKRVKNVPVASKPVVSMQEDGFQQVKNRKRNKGNSGTQIPHWIPFGKGFQVGKDFRFNPRASSGASHGEKRRETAEPTTSSNQGCQNDRNTQVARNKGKDIVDTGVVYTSPNAFYVLGSTLR